MKEIPYQSIVEIPNNKLLKKVNLRPKSALVGPSLFLSLLLFGPLYLKILGIILEVIVLLIYFNVENRHVLDIYQDFIVIFNPEDPLQCQIIKWQDIDIWRYETGGPMDQLLIQNKKDEQAVINIYSPSAFMKYFNRFVKDKNKVIIDRKRIEAQAKAGKNSAVKESIINIFKR